MAKSSIHIQAGAYNFFRHNDRSSPTKNSIFNDEKNECSQPAEAAYQVWKKAIEERAAKYTERTGQKLNKKTITHLSAIVNLNAHHTLDDLQPLADYLEEEFGTKIIQTAIHRDEGHWGEDGTAEKNYHAHLEMVGLDDEGRSVRRKLTRAALSKLQTKTAKILGMERGTNYAAERKPRPKRLDTYEYKVAKEREEQGRREEMAKIKDITEENRRLREQLKERGGSRAEYAKLEAEIKGMKILARRKELTIEEMHSRIADLERENEQLKAETADTNDMPYHLTKKGMKEELSALLDEKAVYDKILLNVAQFFGIRWERVVELFANGVPSKNDINPSPDAPTSPKRQDERKRSMKP